MRWFIYAPLQLLIMIICYITNPIVVLFADESRKANHREAELYEKIKKEVIQKERYHYHSFHVNKLHHQYIGQ